MLAPAAVSMLFVLAETPMPERIFTNTDDVTALAAGAETLWVATGGGLEAYDLATLARRRLYTTVDGLAANAVLAVAVKGGGDVVARTARAICRRDGDRFTCSSAPPLPMAAPATPRMFDGARMTAQLTVNGRRFVGTAGQGVWMTGTRPRRLTPADQLCGNHVTALARFRGETWLGTFDRGLCRFTGQSFSTARAPFRMINDLAVAAGSLFVASTRGLFRTRDGAHFQRVAQLDGRGITGLAVDGDRLWAASPAALWRIPLDGRGRLRGYFLPGGAHAVQAVDAAGGVVWLASEDRGAIRFRGGRFQAFDRAAGLPTSWAVDVAASGDGGAYVATLRHGVLRLDADGAAHAIAGIPDRWSLHVSRGADGVWVGTQGGAARIGADDGGVTVVDGLPNPCVHAVATVSDETWIATEGGVALYRRPAIAQAR